MLLIVEESEATHRWPIEAGRCKVITCGSSRELMKPLSFSELRIAGIIAEKKLFSLYTIISVQEMILDDHRAITKLSNKRVHLIVGIVCIEKSVFMTIEIEIYIVVKDHRHHILGYLDIISPPL
jgi:hypothetical protein